MTCNESGTDTTAHSRPQLALAAETALGIRRLRREQEEAILSIVQGVDTLVIMPTGSGKSAIYQVAASLIPGPTVVVSPLLALQKDQAESLAGARAGKALTLNSSFSEAEQSALIEALGSGEYEFFFMSPEQLQREVVAAALRKARPSLFVIDEAHCIVEWGRDFRPDYLALGPVIRAMNPRPTIVALTATATVPVREKLVESLGMRDPSVIVAGLDRPNIHLAVRRFDDTGAKLEGLTELVAELPKPGIVYCSTRRYAEETMQRLLEAGIEAEAYHAGLRTTQRRTIQERFLDDDVDVLTATKAFGLGINKPNVRFVIHADVPESLDSLYQEAGRAGRDGKPATAVLLYRPEDLHLPQFFAGTGISRDKMNAVLGVAGQRPVWTRTELAEASGVKVRSLGRIVNHLIDIEALDADARGRLRPNRSMLLADILEESQATVEHEQALQSSRVAMVRDYAETDACRRQVLLSYFGEAIQPCGNCDNCQAGTPESIAANDQTEREVEHAEWGKGCVLRVENDRAYVFFDTAGYRVVDLVVAEERDLLRWPET